MNEKQHDIQSLQHALLFLQQEHANTLRGLHQEIHRLQEKCTELTSQLTLGNTSLAVEPAAKEDDRLVREIETLRAENAMLSTTGEGKEKRIKFLEEQLRSREQRFQDERTNASRKISDLEKEIENRTSTITFLNTQLHQIKKQSRDRERGTNRRGVEVTRNDGAVESTRNEEETGVSRTERSTDLVRPKQSQATMEPLSFCPTPPPGTPNRRVRSSRRSGTPPKPAVEGSSSHHIDVSSSSLKQTSRTSVGVSPRHKHTMTDPARPSLGHSHVQRERGLRIANSARPKPSDYEDFLKIHSTSDANILTKSSSEPLPPISTRPGGRQLRTNTMRTRPPHTKNPSSQHVEELIIEPLASPDKTIRITQSPT